MIVMGNGEAKAGKVGFAIRLEPVDQLVCQAFDARAEPFDLTRNEGAVDQSAQSRVRRRLELQHGIRLNGIEGCEVGTILSNPSAVGNAGGILPSEAAVAKQAADLVETASAPEAEVLPEEHAAARMQPGICLVGILDETFLVRIEPQPARRGIEAEVRRRHQLIHHGSLARLARMAPDRRRHANEFGFAKTQGR